MILISFSGHKLSEKALTQLNKEFEVVEEVLLPYIDFNQEIGQQIAKGIDKLEYKIDGSRPLTLIMPGHSSLSAFIYCYIYGLTGHPPDILMLQEDEEGIYMPFKKFKGREIKLSGRLKREELNKM